MKLSVLKDKRREEESSAGCKERIENRGEEKRIEDCFELCCMAHHIILYPIMSYHITSHSVAIIVP
jgi:hypothetical protein